MFNQAEIRCWPILKYKQIKRDGKDETQNVQLALDEPRKRLGVFSRGEELEQVYYNMEVSKYPVMRFKELNLYVMFNGQGQGFRLSFRAEDKADFVRIMRRQAYISESPAKTYAATSNSERVAEWTANRMDRNSFSQPVSSMLPPPRKKPAARNLSVTSFSQDPFRSGSPDSLSSSIGTALSSLSNYTDFSSQSSSHFSSTFSPNPFTPPPPTRQFSTKSVQTDRNVLDQLASDSNFMISCMKRLMEQEKFGDLVKSMRSEIEKMGEEEKETFFRKTIPDKINDNIIRRTPPPPRVVHFPTSDLEKDPFED